jgi:hypothetical protein
MPRYWPRQRCQVFAVIRRTDHCVAALAFAQGHLVEVGVAIELRMKESAEFLAAGGHLCEQT